MYTFPLPNIQTTSEQSCMLHCYHSNCSLAAHATCLAERVCPPPHLIPTVAPCPSCSRELLWGELVRRAKAEERTVPPH